ncbi:hypothetical protein amb3687 [Paramagnetospirillum magneticum AMB-1]|uniref:Uncharacterized protein n=1 Tax=Paramagnetospirillum magneticum (strain ATCC 700264 / AMB-1) TaxID=342108 RepID=Q2W0Y4_PARM1|nr:hypothetical protein amb3687 [Paramagnetospirillum magneticum AMB-1]
MRISELKLRLSCSYSCMYRLERTAFSRIVSPNQKINIFKAQLKSVNFFKTLNDNFFEFHFSSRLSPSPSHLEL